MWGYPEKGKNCCHYSMKKQGILGSVAPVKELLLERTWVVKLESSMGEREYMGADTANR